MTEVKALGIAHLSHVDLGNHNAGEGGSQLSDLKTVGNRPYISGQAYRHAIKDALREITAEGVDCLPAHACGEIETCKMCDLFGYMNTEELGAEGQPPAKRVSPLRVSPLVGQYEQPVTTDMILQYDIETEEGDLSHKIGYREMTENVFRGALALDIPAVGQREIEQLDGDDSTRYSRTLEEEIDANERAERIEQLLEAITNTTQLAGQARHMADFMPDFMVAATLPVYNQRITNAIRVEREAGEVNVKTLRSVLKDLTHHHDSEVWVAGTKNPTVMNNWGDVMGAAEDVEDVTTVDSITGCFEELQNTVNNAL